MPQSLNLNIDNNPQYYAFLMALAVWILSTTASWSSHVLEAAFLGKEAYVIH